MRYFEAKTKHPEREMVSESEELDTSFDDLNETVESENLWESLVTLYW